MDNKDPFFLQNLRKILDGWDHYGMISSNAMKGIVAMIREAEINPDHCEIEYKKEDTGYEVVIRYRRVNK